MENRRKSAYRRKRIHPVNTNRCASQYLSVISSKHCLCLQLELRPIGTEKTRVLPHHYLKIATWVEFPGSRQPTLMFSHAGNEFSHAKDLLSWAVVTCLVMLAMVLSCFPHNSHS